jgi:hypothetical protein
MLALMQRCYEGVRPERFHRDLEEKQYVVLLTESHSGELVGFSTIRTTLEHLGGSTVEVLFSGDTVIHPHYWGRKELQACFARFLLSRKLRRPTRPLYWLLLSGGYKTYLLTVNYFPRTLPRHDWQEPPERRALLDELATRWFGSQYDRERGLLRFSDAHYHVRPGLAPIDREALAHPHIAFFAQLNPGHVHGDELVCLSEIRVVDVLRGMVRIASHQLRQALRRGPRPASARI